MYGPLSIQEKNAGRICGHIMPLSYSNFSYGLRKAGFTNSDFHIDCRKKGALGPSIIFYPLLASFSIKTLFDLNHYDLEVYEENKEILPTMNSLNVLSSRSAIMLVKNKKH